MQAFWLFQIEISDDMRELCSMLFVKKRPHFSTSIRVLFTSLEASTPWGYRLHSLSFAQAWVDPTTVHQCLTWMINMLSCDVIWYFHFSLKWRKECYHVKANRAHRYPLFVETWDTNGVRLIGVKWKYSIFSCPPAFDHCVTFWIACGWNNQKN